MNHGEKNGGGRLVALSLEQFERAARTIGAEHRKAIQDSEDIANELVKAEALYHRQLAVQIALARQEFGTTVAEKMAQGHAKVIEARATRSIAIARDRAC